MRAAPYHFNVGCLECIVLSDGLAHYGVSGYFANAPDDELKTALARHRIRRPQIPTALNCLLVRVDGHIVLIDTGLGQGKGTGRLLAALHHEGITRDAVVTVILSHSHFDHINGVLDEAGCLAFRTARYLLSEAEWNFWRSQDTSFRARSAIQSQIVFMEAESEPLPGLALVSTPGHTPGHIAVELSSDGKRLLYPGDVVAHPIHLEHPGWNIVSDMDREQAIKARRKLLQYASAEHIPLLVYHFAFPGLCRVEAHGSAWSAIAVNGVD